MKKSSSSQKVPRGTLAPGSIQKPRREIAGYARRMHEHGLPDVTSAHDTRHVTTVARYAGRIARHFGGSSKVRTLAEMAGHLHDRIRVASEQLIPREKVVEILKKEFAKEGVSPDSTEIERLVSSAFSERQKMLARGTKISDYEMKNVGGEGISSDELTALFLKTRLSKQMGKNALNRMLNAIKLAGKMPDKKRFRDDLVQSALVFADKFFEANGAFIAFRRAYFMGEREDRRAEMKKNGWNVQEAAIRITLDETNKRIKAFSNLDTIPPALHPFVKYQVQWQHRLKNGLEKREPWAVHLATELFNEGLKPVGKQRSLEQTINEYQPINRQDAAFKAETLRYFNGDLWKTFARLVKP